MWTLTVPAEAGELDDALGVATATETTEELTLPLSAPPSDPEEFSLPELYPLPAPEPESLPPPELYPLP